VLRRIAAVLLMLVTGRMPASAQIGRARQGFGVDPNYWVGLSYGYVSGTTISDQSTAATWEFGYTSQLQATIEKTVQRGWTIGASAGFATAPLTYVTNSFSSVCAGTCAARADVAQYMAFVRGGGGVGFHGLYALEAGMTEFSKFRTTEDGASLAPTTAKYDLSFGLGAGLGYGFSPVTDAYIQESTDLVLHPQGNGAANSAPRMWTFRAGFRVGF
jgi:hypothetical protein